MYFVIFVKLKISVKLKKIYISYKLININIK